MPAPPRLQPVPIPTPIQREYMHGLGSRNVFEHALLAGNLTIVTTQCATRCLRRGTLIACLNRGQEFSSATAALLVDIESRLQSADRRSDVSDGLKSRRQTTTLKSPVGLLAIRSFSTAWKY